MTFNELMVLVLDILPDAVLGEDNDGQIIIYTNLQDGGYNDDTFDSVLVPFEAE